MVKGKIILKIFSSLIILFIPVILVPVYSATSLNFPHLDKSKLKRGCATCHKSHGIRGTLMLSEQEENFCFTCHGYEINAEKLKTKGIIDKHIKTINIQKEFEKPYHHPVEKNGIHRYDEIIPERISSSPRHAECVDCHHHHYVTPLNVMAGIKGVDINGMRINRIKKEYELCFKCHSYSANLPPEQKNKAEIMNISNPSYHPVVGQGKNPNVPSLIPPLSTSTIIKCTTCHNNDEPQGPRGPHGSSYRYLLVRNFSDIDGPENTYRYSLCYGCHNRNSILNDESFQFHKLHISDLGTSCRTCHNPHGSTKYQHLIDFDNFVVMPVEGQINFIDLGNKAGKCYLSCHGKEHNPAIYPGIPLLQQKQILKEIQIKNKTRKK